MRQVHSLIPQGALECEWHQKFVPSEARGLKSSVSASVTPSWGARESCNSPRQLSRGVSCEWPTPVAAGNRHTSSLGHLGRAPAEYSTGPNLRPGAREKSEDL